MTNESSADDLAAQVLGSQTPLPLLVILKKES